VAWRQRPEPTFDYGTMKSTNHSVIRVLRLGWLTKPLRRLVAPWIFRRKVRVLHQMNAVECGAACLAMVLSYHGKKTTVAECTEGCSPGRDGLTARAIAIAAREKGLRVKAYSLELEAFKYMPLPAIVHWEFRHFVVVEKWSPNKVVIVDPASGRRRLSPGEFSDSFTGVTLTFEPGSQFDTRSQPKKSSWHRYLRAMFYTYGARAVLGQILLASLILQVLGLAVPALTKIMIDQVFPLKISNVMAVLAVGILILVTAQAIMGYLRGSLLIYLRGRLDSRVMLDFFEHLLSLPFSFFQHRSSGDLLMRLTSNTAIREMLTNQTISLCLDGTFVLVYLVILLSLSPPFCAIVLAFGVLQIGLVWFTKGRTRHLADRDLATQAEEQSYLVEAVTGIVMLKACGAEDRAFDRWSNLFFNHLNVSLRRSHWSVLVENAMGALKMLSPLLLLWFGGAQVLNGKMGLGTMLALNALAASFLAPLSSLVMGGQQLQIVGAYLDRISDVLDAEPEEHGRTGRKAPPLAGQIEVRNLSFRYSPHSPPVLRNVSIAIAPGQKIALVGPTGSGKSTLAMLLLGLFRPTQGEIAYDGIPLDDIDFRSLRAQVGVVLQESYIFSGTVRQNIGLSNPDISLSEVAAAAALAEVSADIESMPMAYETQIAEGGTMLSGGQRQRLALARALANKPAVLVLDEATSHLDVQTEARVDANLSKLPFTRIVIAHRLSTVRNADLIIMLDQGMVAERGRHKDLLARGGKYAALVRAQLQGDENPDQVCLEKKGCACAGTALESSNVTSAAAFVGDALTFEPLS
jgi:ATP-binding cassette subfamily B protein